VNGIYPNYTGPTQEAVHVSLYPDWVGEVGDVTPVPTGGDLLTEYRPAKRSKMDQQLREEDDIIMMVAAAFVEIM
jgi:hypothetical protein